VMTAATVRGAADQCDPVDIAAAESGDVVGTVLHRVRVFWHKFVSARGRVMTMS